MVLFNLAKRFCSNLKKTPFYDFHIRNGAKMTPYAGWSCASSYLPSIAESHNSVRQKCGLFDVSHMQKIFIEGKDASQLLNYATVTDCINREWNTSKYTLLLNSSAGIVDDAIITKLNESTFYMVSNASRASYVQQHLKNLTSELGLTDVKIEYMTDHGLLALQGPLSSKLMEDIFNVNLDKLYFMDSGYINLSGYKVLVSRCGYTGEDGFEILISPNDCEGFIKKFENKVSLCGLTVRDSLRIEAALALYGNELNEEITPIKAGLMFCIPKSKRLAADFNGAKILLEHIESGAFSQKNGIICDEKIPRKDYSLFECDKKTKIGYVTSGCRSFTIGKNIGLVYLNMKTVSDSNILIFDGRKYYNAEICKTPFIKTRYRIKPNTNL